MYKRPATSLMEPSTPRLYVLHAAPFQPQGSCISPQLNDSVGRIPIGQPDQSPAQGSCHNTKRGKLEDKANFRGGAK
jgi:hypothetical protein